MRLLPGASHFEVTELPVYAPSGSGEHLHVWVEKEGIDSDQVVESLCAATGRPARDVGYAGRKDRVAIARQWFSVRLGDEAALQRLASPPGGRVAVLAVSRDREKLRLGQLRGNRFRLGLESTGAAGELESLRQGVLRLTQFGVENRFGPQRFGTGGANVAIARAWARGDAARAAALCIDPAGGWRLGDPLPSGYRPGPTGSVLGALRRDPQDAERALRAAGARFTKLLASAAQSAIFNAVLDARRAAGLLHTLRAGDVARRREGGVFRCLPEDVPGLNERAAPGVLEVSTTGPLPGSELYAASAAVTAEERRWGAAADIDWEIFERGRPLASPGDRRALVVPFLEKPDIEEPEPAASPGPVRLGFALPPGSYATEVLAQLGIEVPARR
jgi:tRNA pseudouridine13 synthase